MKLPCLTSAEQILKALPSEAYSLSTFLLKQDRQTGFCQYATLTPDLKRIRIKREIKHVSITAEPAYEHVDQSNRKTRQEGEAKQTAGQIKKNTGKERTFTPGLAHPSPDFAA